MYNQIHWIDTSDESMTLKAQLEFAQFKDNDLPQIMPIENQIYPNPWSEKVMRDCIKAGYQCIKGIDPRQTDDIMCYAVMMVGYQETNLLNIGVNPAFKKMGLGSQLLHRLLLISRINHAKQMWLEVRASNQAALNLYQKFGFKEVGLRKNYYQYQDPTGKNIKEHAILMSRKVMK